ncbi:MAG: bifunctional nuclease family protein [Planctomycetota bacterium]|nr:bifunctional nuclease family protein [Planctomycetota bacterium]
MPEWVECELGQLLMPDDLAGPHVLVLREKNGARRFMVYVGAFEALAVRRQVHGEIPPRPLTHDLMLTLLSTLGGELRRVAVSSLVEDEAGNGIFHGLLVVGRDGGETMVDCRPSDAIALAVRAGCPIYVSREVLDKAGVPT